MSKKNRLFLSADSTGLHICDLQIYKFSSEQKKNHTEHVHSHLLPNLLRASCYSQAQASLWIEACAKEPEP